MFLKRVLSVHSTWSTLENPLRISAILGVVGSSLALSLTLLVFVWPGPDLTVASGVDLGFVGFVPYSLPFLSGLMLLGSLMLLFKPMSQERRGILGFSVFLPAAIVALYVPSYIPYMRVVIVYVWLWLLQLFGVHFPSS